MGVTVREHHLAPGTHTAELEQIDEINAALATGGRVTAGALGLAAIPADAVLCLLEAAGPPSYPYVFGHFSSRGAADTIRVELHTAQLCAISHELHLHSHVWGIPPSVIA